MTHKDEICYWSEHPNGTGVWTKWPNSEWEITVTPTWVPEVIYIVNNEWSEIRKKNACGEVVQFNYNNEWHDLADDWWNNDFHWAHRKHSIEKYRIKPKEWYDQLDGTKENAVICWVWDGGENKKTRTDIITEYDKDVGETYKFRGKSTWWMNAIPIKPEECWKGK